MKHHNWASKEHLRAPETYITCKYNIDQLNLLILPSWYWNAGSFRLNTPTGIGREHLMNCWQLWILTDNKICLFSEVNTSDFGSRQTTYYRDWGLQYIRDGSCNTCGLLLWYSLWGANTIVISLLQDASTLPSQKIEGQAGYWQEGWVLDQQQTARCWLWNLAVERHIWSTSVAGKGKDWCEGQS